VGRKETVKMTETRSLLYRLFERMLENRRLAAQRRVDAYLEGIGIADPRGRK
jgi:hypothetical protein